MEAVGKEHLHYVSTDSLVSSEILASAFVHENQLGKFKLEESGIKFFKAFARKGYFYTTKNDAPNLVLSGYQPTPDEDFQAQVLKELHSALVGEYPYILTNQNLSLKRDTTNLILTSNIRHYSLDVLNAMGTPKTPIPNSTLLEPYFITANKKIDFGATPTKI